ncbi:MAG: glutamine synthetase family protein [Chloroflexi bacterium]|nr:glutamine synthetase family protein [Chloroflexota bacterium]
MVAETTEYILASARENDVKFIRLWFTDILGSLKSFAITVGELEKAMEEGMSFDGSSIEGFARVDESDMIAKPDASTFVILPWRPQQQRVARMICDIFLPDGTPFEGDPRNVLRRQLARAAKLGYSYYVGPELEFFYFKGPDDPTPLDAGGYFDLTPLDVASDLRRETVLTLEEMGIPVAYSHHEVAPSQHEIDLRYTDAMTMADAAMTYRLVVKEVAMRNGVYASFMPKPLDAENGSGMHVNQSLFKGDENAFYDPASPEHLSATAGHYVAGLLRHAADFTLVTNQWVNSYKRLQPGYEAPVYVTWAYRNRSDLIRIPARKPNRPESTRIEYRAADAACNPYFAFAVNLSAGLEGIEQQRELPPPSEENVYSLSESERRERGIETLPGSLGEAIDRFAVSKLMRETLGDHVFDSFLENKRIEWNDYRAHVSDFEMKRYFPVL